MKILKKRRKAFTLIELLAVLTILAIVVGIAGPAIWRQVTKGKMDAARTEIGGIEKALNLFYLDCGFYPSTEQGLESLVSQPASGEGRECKNYNPDGYLEKGVPLDPWDSEYYYESPGQNRTSSFDLYSAGPDAQPGTEDDVNNWE